MTANKPPRASVCLVEITAAQVDQRLDNFLIKRLAKVPRTRIYRALRKGEVRVNKKRSKPDYRLRHGDLVRIPPLAATLDASAKPRPPAGLVRRLEGAILFENEHLVVIDKPASLAVHGGSGLSWGLIDAMRQIYGDEIELVHRLDRDTSGCLMLARHRAALVELQDLLRERRIGKVYFAVVQGRWPPERVEVALPLRRYHLANGERRVCVDEGGKPALSRFRVMRGGKRHSLLRVEIETGRTHQIRVHCQALGHPVAGDDKYGDADFNRALRGRGIRRLMLHASSLELPGGVHFAERVVTSPLPAEFAALAASDG